MKKIKIVSLFLGVLVFFGPASLVLANEGTSSESSPSDYSCNQDPMYQRDFNTQVTISSRLRSMPCMAESEVLRVLGKGQVVKVIAEMDGWYKIKDSDGAVGWVGATLLSKTDAAVTTSNSIISKATAEVSKAVATVKGYILLQVEQRGEAWYVNPENSFRYYLKDGETAYNVMREMGLGISNANLAKLQAKQKDLVERLKGRIVLQVEKNGEAYYVNPKTGLLHYLKNGAEAYNIMRNLSLGIKNSDLSKIPNSTLEAYTKVKENVKNETSSIIPVIPAISNGQIILSGFVFNGKVSLSWGLNNMTSAQGFKVVMAKHENPVYPGDEYHYFSDASVRSDSWNNLESGTYYFRVCEYLGGKCGVYSNNVELEF